jgi:hypothetical protein
VTQFRGFKRGPVGGRKRALNGLEESSLSKSASIRWLSPAGQELMKPNSGEGREGCRRNEVVSGNDSQAVRTDLCIKRRGRYSRKSGMQVP